VEQRAPRRPQTVARPEIPTEELEVWQLEDRELLEELVRFVRLVRPLLEHPWARGFLRRT